MVDNLITYLQDHLAGARFAVTLLEDLSKQDTEVATIARDLLPEIEADKQVLEALIRGLGGEASVMKEAAAWILEKAGRLKLDLDHPLGIFEAVETLTLGVLGKLALWTALQSTSKPNSRVQGLDLDELAIRARSQHEMLESLRLKLAATVLS
jgi:hypothetical protein